MLLQFFLIFKSFSCSFFEIHYRPRTIVCQNILKAIVQYKALNSMQYFVSIVEMIV